MRAFASGLCAIAILTVAGGVRAQPSGTKTASLTSLEQEVERAPHDLDVRLRLALQLAREGHRKEARKHADDVVAEAPHYWDAQLLLVRLDAWDGQYDRALARLAEVRRQVPHHRDVLPMWADVAFWSGRRDETLRALAAWEAEGGRSAEIEYRRAALENQGLETWHAYQLTRGALTLDAQHEGARRLKQDLSLLSLRLTSELEVFPIDDPDVAVALGEVLTATLLPRARWSVSMAYEYRRRFATNNHRVSVWGDWRVTDELTLTAGLRGGVTVVIPEFGGEVAAQYVLGKVETFGLRYSIDKMPWPGHLHQLRPSLGLALPRHLSAEAGASLGTLVHCGDARFVYGAQVKAGWSPPPWEFGISYGFGMEFDRPELPGFVAGSFGEDACPGDAPTVPLELLNLVDTRGHDLGAGVAYWFDQKTMARLGYGARLRFDGNVVHSMFATIARWF